MQIRLAQKVCRVLISRENSSGSFLVFFLENLSMGRANANFVDCLPIFLVGPMAAFQPVCAHGVEALPPKIKKGGCLAKNKDPELLLEHGETRTCQEYTQGIY